MRLRLVKLTPSYAIGPPAGGLLSHPIQRARNPMSAAPKPTLSPTTHTPYSSRDLSTKSEAYKATLEIMFCHMADMFEVVVGIIAEKYGHSKEEMIATVKTHPAFETLRTHPVIDGLNYITEAELPVADVAAVPAAATAAVKEVSAVLSGTSAREQGTAAATEAAAVPKKKRMIRKKTVVATSAPENE